MLAIASGTLTSWDSIPQRLDALLQFGCPRETDDASILTPTTPSHHEGDFPFLRRDIAGVKELSVDIAANWYGPTANEAGFELHTLVECKYRSPEKILLLLEDPNEEFSPATLGGTVSSFDAWIPFHLPLDAFVPIERNLHYVYKCIVMIGSCRYRVL